MQNSITREVIIKAAKEKVYDAIANPLKVVRWFPDEIEGTYAVGERPLSVFKEHNAKVSTYIVDAKPFEYFAYRWIPGGNEFTGDVMTVPNTLVEFTIQEIEDGTCKVVVTESGFAQLPAEMAEVSFKQNSGGWDYMLGRFEKYFKQA